jgi:hypothetical protein
VVEPLAHLAKRVGKFPSFEAHLYLAHRSARTWDTVHLPLQFK